jgi:shikimate dehydrogenase
MIPNVDPHSSRLQFGLIGHPVEQSLSPLLFRFLFDLQGFNAEYTAWDVKSVELEETLQRIRVSRIEGVNVTIPHKADVISYLDVIDHVASCIGAVNCVARKNDQLIGYNTDYIGIVQTLLPYRSVIDQSTVAVLGAGGAARAAIYALLTVFDPRCIMICNRTPENAEYIILDFRLLKKNIQMEYIHPDNLINFQLDQVINCIPNNHLNNLISSQQKLFYRTKLFFDLNYRSNKNDVTDCFGNPEMKFINGMEMLVHQAAESYKIWTGQSMPISQSVDYLNGWIKR